MNYSKLTSIAALATTILAGSMTADINDQNQLLQRGLDPVIIDLLQRVENGTLSDRYTPKRNKGLRQRVLDRSKKPAIGVRRDDTRLQIKFADELQVRIKDNGTVISRTNRSISDITSIIEDFELTLTPAIPASEDRIDALMSRAQHHSRKQTPDIGGMYWVDGVTSAVSAAANVFHSMDDVEWVFWNTIMDPAKHTSDRASIFSELHQQETTAMLAAANHRPQTTGACLIDDRTCESGITRDACIALAGIYLGDFSICKSNESEERVVPTGACCLILLTGAPTGGVAPGFFGCLDDITDGVTLASCTAITAGAVFGNGYVTGLHANGVWFDGEDCAGITADCITPPPGSFICGDLSDPATIFSGDCYHNQFDPVQTWDNRFVNGLGLPGTPGCWDAPGYPLVAPTPATTATAGDTQGLCDAITEIDTYCGDTGWDDICASYALSSEFVGSGISQYPPAAAAPELSGLSGDCGSPWGTNHRPIPVNSNGTLGTQPMMTVATNGTLAPRTVTQGLTVLAYGCGWNPAGTAVPGLPVFTPVGTSSPTPDFGPEVTLGLGLMQHLTDEVLGDVAPLVQTVAVVADPALLAWPLGGAQVGDITFNTTYSAVANPIIPGAGLPVTSFPRGDTRWSGAGLNLFADFTATSGIGNGNAFGGLYGLGYRKQVETGVANGTHGAGVKVAVLDYAAYIQTYLVDTTVPPNGTLDTLIGGIHEDLSVDTLPVGNLDGIPDVGVLLEGTATGHTPIQMLFNPPDTNDYPFDFPQSPNHGTAQLGVIAASWGAIPNVTGTVPSNGVPPTPGTNFGAMGIAPQATTAFFPLMDNDSSGGGGTGGRVETAWFNAMEWLSFGDVLSAGYVALDNGGTFPNVGFNPSVNSLIETATNLGISVVIEAGDSSADLSQSEYPNGVDPGAIVVCATTPGGAPAKRWADSTSASNYVAGAIDTSRNTCAAWGMGVVTCGMGPAQDNWLGYNTITYNNPTSTTEVQGRSYTNNYGGTSAAAAITAGCVASIQGYARQVYSTPLGPMILRHYMAHGQVLGNDPVTGEPLMSIINSAGTATNVLQQTEHNMETTGWPATGGLSFDQEETDAGGGNIVGYFANPWYACLRSTVDPIFDHPNISSIVVIRGTLLEGNINSIASIDGIYYGVNSVHTADGEYDLPATVPGNSILYSFNGEATDVYLTGVAVDPRGDPLLTLKKMTFQVTLAPTQADVSFLQLWMWDFIEGEWRQPSLTAVLAEGSTEQDFEILRSGSLLDSDGTYHARFVSISPPGPFNRSPIYYDQIRLIPTIPGTTP